MSEPNQINKLYLQDGITVTPVDMALFAFNSGNAMEKSTYSIVERYINVTEAIEDFLSVYYFEGKDNYYEYHINLSQASTTLSGKDKFNNTLSNCF